MKLLYGHGKAVASLVARLIPGCERGFGASTAIGVIDEAGRLVGGVVYYDWNPESGVMQLSAASTNPRWLTRHIMRGLLAYPFDEVGCQLVVFRVAPENRRTRRLIRALGGTEYEIPRLGGRDKAEVLITLTDDAWRASKFMR